MRLWVLQLVGAAALVALWEMGWLGIVFEADVTYIVEAICALTVLAIILASRGRWDYAEEIRNDLPTIGLIGTMIGFLIAFGSNISAESMVSETLFKGVVADMLSGIGTAINTTLAGVVGYLWLRLCEVLCKAR